MRTGGNEGEKGSLGTINEGDDEAQNFGACYLQSGGLTDDKKAVRCLVPHTLSWFDESSFRTCLFSSDGILAAVMLI